MIFEKIKFYNIQSYKSCEINLEDLGVTGIVGNYIGNSNRSNGSGKTTIFKAIIYCLFGYGQLEDELIREGEEECGVILDLRNQKDKIRIERYKSHSKTMLKLELNGKDISESKPETQAKIEKLIGLDDNLLLATAFFEQSGNDSFTAATPAIRKEYLKKLLRLEFYDSCYEISRKKYKEIENKLEDFVSKLEYVSEKIKNTNIKLINEEIILLEKKKEKTEDAIKQEKDEYKKYRDLKQKNSVAKTNLQNAELYLKDEKENYDDTLSKIKEIEKNSSEKFDKKKESDLIQEVVDLQKEDRDCALKIGEYEVMSKSLLKNSSLIEKNTKCPTCRQKISDDSKQQIIKENSELVSQYKKKIEELSVKQLKLKDKIQSSNKQLKALRELEYKNKDSGKLESYKENLQELKKQIDLLTSKIVLLKKEISVNVKEYEEKYKDKEFEDQQLEENLKDIIESISENKEKKKTFDQLNEEKKILKSKVSRFNDRVNICNIVKNAFSKNGIVADIINNSIKELENEANEVLNELDDGNQKIIFETVEELKSEKLKDSLEIWVENISTGKRRRYRQFSGGQKAILNFCIRMALSLLLSKRENTWFGVVFMDEPFGALDEYNRAKMRKVIKYLKTMFKQIFVISHTDMQDSFNNTIKISYDKKKNLSEIQEVI